jgi:hypothetical protein
VANHFCNSTRCLPARAPDLGALPLDLHGMGALAVIQMRSLDAAAFACAAVLSTLTELGPFVADVTGTAGGARSAVLFTSTVRYARLFSYSPVRAL